MTENGYDDLLDDVASGGGFYLRCPDGHGSLPPRRACPTCGDTRLTRAPFDGHGTLVTYTVVHVAAAGFPAEPPYATAVASFGDVRVTGVLTGVDPDDAAVGMDVRLDCAEWDGERALALTPP